jgi:hypothetical protein
LRRGVEQTLRALQRDDMIGAGLFVLMGLAVLWLAGSGVARMLPQVDYRFLLQDGVISAAVVAAVFIFVLLKGLSRVSG